MPIYPVTDKATGALYHIRWDSAGPMTDGDIERLIRAQQPNAADLAQTAARAQGKSVPAANGGMTPADANLGGPPVQVRKPVTVNGTSYDAIQDPRVKAMAADLPTVPTLGESAQGLGAALRSAGGVYQAADTPITDLIHPGFSAGVSQLDPSGRPSAPAQTMNAALGAIPFIGGGIQSAIGMTSPQTQANIAQTAVRSATPLQIGGALSMGGPAWLGAGTNATLGLQGALAADDPAKSTFDRIGGGVNAVLGGANALASLRNLRSPEIPGAVTTGTKFGPVEPPPPPPPGAPPAGPAGFSTDQFSAPPTHPTPPPPPSGGTTGTGSPSSPLPTPTGQTFSSGQFSAPTPTSSTPTTPRDVMAAESHAMKIDAHQARMRASQVSLDTATARLKQILATQARTEVEQAQKVADARTQAEAIATIKADLIQQQATVVENYKAPNAAGGTDVGRVVYGQDPPPAAEGGGGGETTVNPAGPAGPKPRPDPTGPAMNKDGSIRAFFMDEQAAQAQAKALGSTYFRGADGRFEVQLPNQTAPPAAPAAPQAPPPVAAAVPPPPAPIVAPGAAQTPAAPPAAPPVLQERASAIIPTAAQNAALDATFAGHPSPSITPDELADPTRAGGAAAASPGAAPPPPVEPPAAAPAPPSAPTPKPAAKPRAPKPAAAAPPPASATGTPPPKLNADTPEERKGLRAFMDEFVRSKFPGDTPEAKAKRAAFHKAVGGVSAATDQSYNSAADVTNPIPADEAWSTIEKLIGHPLPKPGGESGAASIGTALNLAKYGTGAALGAAGDPQHPVRGAVVGGVLAHAAGPLLEAGVRYPAPAVRAVTGAGAGAYIANDQGKDPLLGGAVGGLAGAAIPWNPESRAFLKAIDSARYEGALAGSAQLSKIAGDVGGLVASPILDALGGNTASAMQMLRQYAHPLDTLHTGINGFKAGLRDLNPEMPFGPHGPTIIGGKSYDAAPIRPIGIAGRTLHAVNAGTQAILMKGGKTADQAKVLTYSGDPVTRAGAGLAMLQSTLPGRILTPFARTAINQAEFAGALSPVRYFDPKLRALVPASGPAGDAALATLAPAALAAGSPELRKWVMSQVGMGDSAGTYAAGSSNQSKAALAGPLTTPLAVGHAIHDYARYGKSGLRDATQAALNEVPFLADIPRIAENPGKIAQGVISQPIPRGLLAIGDLQERVTSSAGDAIRERIPALRENLPLKRDYLGQPIVRNAVGQEPPPIYDTNPFAGKLADLGLLHRAQSPAEAGQTLSPAETSRLQELRGQGMTRMLQPPLMGGALDSAPKSTPIEDYLKTVPPDQAKGLKTVMAISQRLNPSAKVPVTQMDLIKMLEQMGIKLGTQQSDQERLAAAAGGR